MTTTPYCSTCGMQLWRSSINNMLRCLCKNGANVIQCYDDRGVPYRVEKAPRQAEMRLDVVDVLAEPKRGRLVFCEDCGASTRSKHHREQCSGLEVVG